MVFSIELGRMLKYLHFGLVEGSEEQTNKKPSAIPKCWLLLCGLELYGISFQIRLQLNCIF